MTALPPRDMGQRSGLPRRRAQHPARPRPRGGAGHGRAPLRPGRLLYRRDRHRARPFQPWPRPNSRKLSLELGGKNATVVFDDCDFDAALSTAMCGRHTPTKGQICLCGSRILVQEGIYDRFRDAMVAKVSKLRIGDPMDPATKNGRRRLAGTPRQGPGRHRYRPRRRRAHPVRRRATPTGSAPAGKGGFFVQPTLIEGLGPQLVSPTAKRFLGRSPRSSPSRMSRRRWGLVNCDQSTGCRPPCGPNDLKARPPGGRSHRHRYGLAQLLACARPPHAVWRHPPFRGGPRRGLPHHALLHRASKRLHTALKTGFAAQSTVACCVCPLA